jgi:hypothetical protein
MLEACRAKCLLIIVGLVTSVNSSAQTLTTMVSNGASSNRVDMVFIGDGYQASELSTTYVSHVNGTISYFFNNPLSSPFGRYQNFFNIHRVNIASNQSGADDPVNGVFVDTALDATYNTGGVDRCLYFSDLKANTALNTALAGSGIDVDMRLGAVNSVKYGGCGGSWAVWSAANGSAQEIAVHEVGHSFAGLADEYFSPGSYTGGELSEWNATNNPASGKWNRWVGYNDPSSDIGAIGYYEGGRYFQNGIWRPSDNSKMRALNRPFDAVSREKFVNEIYREVDPLDAWLANGSTLVDPSSLWVDSVDPAVISVEWFLNGSSLGVLGETLNINSLGLAVGNHQLRARAFDNILNTSFSGGALDWWRLAADPLQQNITWNITVTSVPEPGSILFGAGGMIAFMFRRNRV